jgi:Tol biopolymer transport system component
LRGHPFWSPDGSQLAFAEWVPDDPGWTVQTHIINADGTGERTLPDPPGTVWQAPESWSNDGTRLLVIRGYNDGDAGAQPAVVPVDGSGPGIAIKVSNSTFSPTETHTWEWAPDDSYILGTPAGTSADMQVMLDPVGQVMLDPVKGTSRTMPWASVSLPSTQRDAP